MLEEPAAVILHGGVCEGGELSVAMVDLNAHAAGNGGQSQGKPKAQGVLLYSEFDNNPERLGVARLRLSQIRLSRSQLSRFPLSLASRLLP